MNKAAQIIAERLAQSIIQKRISDTGALLEEIDWKAVNNQIRVIYNYYGVFRELGVGKYVPMSKVDDSNRKRSKWATKVIYREVARINEIMAKKAGMRAVDVVARISDNRLSKQEHINLTL
jgi:hypothetical protein